LRVAPSLIFLLLSSLPLHAQGQTFLVDPVNGDDILNTGGATDPFLSLTHALSVARALGTTGHTIELLTGTYSESGVIGSNEAESFPIVLLPGTNVEAGNLQVPVFDGNGAATVFSLLDDFPTSTSLSEVGVINCQIGLANGQGSTLRGFVLEDSDFTFSAKGVFFQFQGTTDNQVVVRNTNFTGEFGAADTAVEFNISSNGDLSGGSVEGCTITGCAIGVDVQATDGSGGVADYAVGTGFEIKGNLIENFSLAGVRISAKSGATGPCRVGCLVTGNDINGGFPAFTPPGGQVGLLLESSNTTQGGEASLMESGVQYNEIIGCETCVKLTTNGGTANQADLTSAFLGNLVQLSTQAGVVFEVNGFAPSPFSNNLPNFGTYGSFLQAGRNVISNHPPIGVVPATGAVVLDLDMNSFLSMPDFHGNWWDASPVSEGSVLSFFINTNGASNFGTSQLSPVFQFSMEATVAPSTITEGSTPLVTVSAGGGFLPNSAFFHDFDLDSRLENMAVHVGNILIDLNDSDTSLSSDGSALTFRFPNLSAGTYNLNLQNPGGPFVVDNGTGIQPNFQVNTPSGSAEGGGPCFVATAVFENPHAAEVETLRRFRDRWLLTWEGGRSFVSWYYENGPTAAEWVGARPWARTVSRVALVPPIWMATALERWNPGQRLLVGVLLLGLAFSLGRRRPMFLST
jgi:hypothetical protein